MKTFNKIKNTGLALIAFTAMLSACNKAPMDPVPNKPPSQGTTPTLATLLDDPEFSILKAAVAKARLGTILGNANLRYTVFAPNDAAFIASGIPSADIINNNAILDTPTVTALVSYHIVPQVISSASIPQSFPNFQYPTIFNPAPQLSALLRLTTFPSRRPNGNWVNNIPITQLDVQAVNGVLHKVARVVAPPSQYLWNRIDNDPDLTYLKAAIIRADEGTGTLQAALLNIGANLTVFAPNNAAMSSLLIALGLPDNPATFNALPVETVKGIVVYHILGTRAFTNNIFTEPTLVPTLLNGGVPAHPGVSIDADFAGPFVTAATAKGAANANASNVIINPAPNGSSDQHYLNGVLHKIDQVLLPQ
ncbi:MAG: fasciclin domain-containing protein [Chitinophagaceae bacterium]|nr:fasciclin domain-containing protein [Chitinophagaceae bacterium]